MATTTNFGWETPDDTDLVKDGAAAIRTLGQSIDTSMMDLEGGTTGQVLSKASNADMDFTWVTTDDTNAIQNAIVDAKGDLIAATAPDTPARLAVGTNGQVLTADSTAATGLAWATPASGSMTLLNTGATNLAGLGSTVTFSSLSGSYKNLFVNLYGANPSSGTAELVLRFNGDTGTNYPHMEYYFAAGASTPALYSQNSTGIDLSSFGRSYLQQSASNFWNIQIPNYTRTGYRVLMLNDTQDLGNTRVASGVAAYKGSAAITSLSIILTAGTWTTGTIEIYGVN